MGTCNVSALCHPCLEEGRCSWSEATNGTSLCLPFKQLPPDGYEWTVWDIKRCVPLSPPDPYSSNKTVVALSVSLAIVGAAAVGMTLYMGRHFIQRVYCYLTAGAAHSSPAPSALPRRPRWYWNPFDNDSEVENSRGYAAVSTPRTFGSWNRRNSLS